MPRFVKIACWFALLGAMSSCSKNLTRFDIIRFRNTGGSQITRAETADQGSGSVATSTGYTLTRVTVGGYYLRRVGVAAPGGHSMNAGLFGNPTATQ